jgi:hypothetical protein
VSSGVWPSAALVVGAWSVLTVGCATDARIFRAKQQVLAAAHAVRRQDGLHCAPEELARADANLRFAALELRAGDDELALQHLTLAELNARAAQVLARVSCPQNSGSEGAPAKSSSTNAPRHDQLVLAPPSSVTTLGLERGLSALDTGVGSATPRPAY